MVDESWLHNFDPENKVQSVAWKHAFSPHPRKFPVVASARNVMATVFWDADGIVLTDYLDHGSTIIGTYYTVHWSDQRSSVSIEGEETRKVTSWVHSTRTTHMLTCHLKNWLPSEMLNLNYFTTHCIQQIWLQVTIIHFLNWRNSWKEANLLTAKMLSAWQMAAWKSMIYSSSTVESQLWRNAWPSGF